MKKKQNIVALVKKYLENRCNETELDELIHLLHEGAYEEQVEILLYRYWQTRPSFQQKLDQKELDEMLNSIHHQIHIEEDRKSKKLLNRVSHYAVRVAAILFIPLLIGTLWYIESNSNYVDKDAMVKLETPLGSKLKTTLPDGTEVWQNAGTTLKYPAQFSSKHREVELSGEAYFHVSSDKKNPFFVRTAEGVIVVTGTRFNISNFSADDFLSIVLEEGEVIYRPLDSESEVELRPSEQILHTKANGTIEKQEVDVEKYTSWKEGKLVFRNDELVDVIKRLNRWYDADVELYDPRGIISTHRVTMTIQHETLPQVLDYITQAANLKLEQDEYKLSATGEKKKPHYKIFKK